MTKLLIIAVVFVIVLRFISCCITSGKPQLASIPIAVLLVAFIVIGSSSTALEPEVSSRNGQMN